MRRPKLTSEVLRDPEALARALDALLLGSREWKKLSARVRRQQGRLQRLVDDRAWKAYLNLEATVNESACLEVELILKRALGNGGARRNRERTT